MLAHKYWDLSESVKLDDRNLKKCIYLTIFKKHLSLRVATECNPPGGSSYWNPDLPELDTLHLWIWVWVGCVVFGVFFCLFLGFFCFVLWCFFLTQATKKLIQFLSIQWLNDRSGFTVVLWVSMPQLKGSNLPFVMAVRKYILFWLNWALTKLGRETENNAFPYTKIFSISVKFICVFVNLFQMFNL